MTIVAKVGLLEQIENSSKGVEKIHKKLRSKESLSPKHKMSLKKKIKQLNLLLSNSKKILECLQD